VQTGWSVCGLSLHQEFDTEDIDICSDLDVSTYEIYDTHPHNLFVA